MPMFETSRGSRMQLLLPQSEFEELQEACKAYTDLMNERRVTGALLGKLEEDRSRAIEADRIALGKAIKDGTSDPGDKNVEQIEKKIKGCNRRLEALEHALDQAEIDLLEVLDEHRDDWVAELEAKHAEAQAVYREAIDALSASHAKVSQSFALLRWVKHFPEEETTFRVRGTFLGSLKAQNGEPYWFDQVIAALVDDATPQAPPEVQAFQPLQPRGF
jgi:hypothetical protein